jgi:hypothetical protein
MRQCPIRLANDKYIRSLETSALPLQYCHDQTVAWVIWIKDPPITLVIAGSMFLVRPAPARRIWQWRAR